MNFYIQKHRSIFWQYAAASFRVSICHENKNEFAASKCIRKMNAAKWSLQSQLIIFVISLSNDLDNKEEHSNAHAVFHMPTLCQHLFTATERPDAPLLCQAVGKASRQQPELPGVTMELTTPGSSKTSPDWWLLGSCWPLIPSGLVGNKRACSPGPLTRIFNESSHCWLMCLPYMQQEDDLCR